jgi:fructose-specific phosphotransferase system IIC component
LASALVLLVLALLLAAKHEYVAAGFVGAFAAAFPLGAYLQRVSHSFRVTRRLRLPTPVLQLAAFAVLALGLSVCEIVGIGLHRDVVRGLLALVGSIAFAVATAKMAQAFRTDD